MLAKDRNDRGFTIIEVVLVLAIAGLIFIVVFVAFPQLSRSRRDHQRRLAAQFVVGQLEGTQPYPRDVGQHTAFVNSLSGNDLLLDPSTGVMYVMDHRPWGTEPHSDVPAPGEIHYQVAHRCSMGPDPIEDVPPTENYTAFAVWVGLEQGSYACFDNS